MTHPVRLETSPARPLAVVRGQVERGALARFIPEACGFVWKHLKEEGVSGAGRHVALYLDDAITLEVGVELAAPWVGDGVVAASATPAGRVATTIHLGPYQRLGEAHEALRRWCAEQGHALAGPSWEIYGHWEEAWNHDASRIRTDVCYLLREPNT